MKILRWLVLGLGASVPVALAAEPAATPNPQAQALLDELARGHPELRTLVRRYPALMKAFADPENAEVLRGAPNLPGTPWRVHDIRRPQPRVVAPGRCDTRPSRDGAIALFDGRDLGGWTGEHIADWRVADGVLTAGGRNYNMIRSTRPLGDAVIHLEFREPTPPANDWQHRGNGGLYLMGRYEVQILDSYRNPTFPDGQAAAIFGQTPPRVNASAPPGAWQCFDLRWRAPRFAGGRLVAPARLTMWHNGILVHRDIALAGPTGYAVVTPYAAHGAAPIELQDHGDPAGRVSYRNIWIRPLGASRRSR